MKALFLFLLLLPSQSFSQSVPFSCADTVHRYLGSFIGTWEVRSLFRSGPEAWDSTRGTVVIAPDLDGCLLREEYVGRRYGKPYHYIALWGANGMDGRIQRTFAHSQHGYLGIRSGDFVADTLVLQGSTMVRGTEIIEQDRITRPVDERFERLTRRSSDGGKTWRVTSIVRFRLTEGW